MSAPDYGRLKSSLAISKLQATNNAAYQTILSIIDALQAVQVDLQSQLTQIEINEGAIADTASSILLRGTRAEQPDASLVPVDAIYFVTDEFVTEQSNGTSWVDYADSGASGITQLTGDVTAGPGFGSQVATIAANVVTFAKMQQIAAHRLVGRFNTGTGNIELLSLGTGLTDAGGVLDTVGSAGADPFIAALFLGGM